MQTPASAPLDPPDRERDRGQERHHKPAQKAPEIVFRQAQRAHADDAAARDGRRLVERKPDRELQEAPERQQNEAGHDRDPPPLRRGQPLLRIDADLQRAADEDQQRRPAPAGPGRGTARPGPPPRAASAPPPRTGGRTGRARGRAPPARPGSPPADRAPPARSAPPASPGPPRPGPPSRPGRTPAHRTARPTSPRTGPGRPAPGPRPSAQTPPPPSTTPPAATYASCVPRRGRTPAITQLPAQHNFVAPKLNVKHELREFGAARAPQASAFGRALSSMRPSAYIVAMTSSPIHVVGGGLAGSEAAWQIAQAGLPVVLHEMRPVRGTPAHQTDGLAELVCSNSFRSDDWEHNAVGLLHAEMRRAGSLIMACGRRPPGAGGRRAGGRPRGLLRGGDARALAGHPRVTHRARGGRRRRRRTGTASSSPPAPSPRRRWPRPSLG